MSNMCSNQAYNPTMRKKDRSHAKDNGSKRDTLRIFETGKQLSKRLMDIFSKQIALELSPSHQLVFAMARENKKRSARSRKKAKFGKMTDYIDDQAPDPSTNPPEQDEEITQRGEDEEKENGGLDEENDEHNPGSTVQRLMQQVGRQLADDITTRNSLVQVSRSYDKPQDLVDGIADCIKLVLNKTARNGQHQNGSQGVDEERTTSFAGHPAVIYLHSDMHELGKIGQLGGEWSLDCWHKNQNGRTICLSSRNKRKRQESTASIDDNDDESEQDEGGPRKRQRTETQQPSSEETATDDEAHKRGLPRKGKTGSPDEATIVTPSSREKDALTPSVIANLRAELLQISDSHNRSISISDAAEVVTPPVDPNYRGPRRWGFNRPIQGVRGQWQFVTWTGDDPNRACDESQAQMNVARSNGYGNLHYATAQDVYDTRQDLQLLHGVNNRTRGIRIVWVPAHWNTEIHAPAQNGAASTNASSQTASAKTQDTAGVNNGALEAEDSEQNNDVDSEATTDIPAQTNGPSSPAGSTFKPPVSTESRPANPAAGTGPPPSREASVSKPAGGKTTTPGTGRWLRNKWEEKETVTKTVGVAQRPEDNPDAMIPYTGEGRFTRFSVAQIKPADTQFESDMAAPPAPPPANNATPKKGKTQTRKGKRAIEQIPNSRMFPNVKTDEDSTTAPNSSTKATEDGLDADAAGSRRPICALSPQPPLIKQAMEKAKKKVAVAAPSSAAAPSRKEQIEQLNPELEAKKRNLKHLKQIEQLKSDLEAKQRELKLRTQARGKAKQAKAAVEEFIPNKLGRDPVSRAARPEKPRGGPKVGQKSQPQTRRGNPSSRTASGELEDKREVISVSSGDESTSSEEEEEEGEDEEDKEEGPDFGEAEMDMHDGIEDARDEDRRREREENDERQAEEESEERADL